ncbi:MAG: hypothetical protein HY885_11295 [Deltaproteobacteria bacterium]|nr:hypothetical protein [Deltaproteobacteria bacterium]
MWYAERTKMRYNAGARIYALQGIFYDAIKSWEKVFLQAASPAAIGKKQAVEQGLSH